VLHRLILAALMLTGAMRDLNLTIATVLKTLPLAQPHGQSATATIQDVYQMRAMLIVPEAGEMVLNTSADQSALSA
jgi:hypothetical protein